METNFPNYKSKGEWVNTRKSEAFKELEHLRAENARLKEHENVSIAENQRLREKILSSESQNARLVGELEFLKELTRGLVEYGNRAYASIQAHKEALEECVVALAPVGNRTSYEPFLLSDSMVIAMKSALVAINKVLNKWLTKKYFNVQLLN